MTRSFRPAFLERRLVSGRNGAHEVAHPACIGSIRPPSVTGFSLGLLSSYLDGYSAQEMPELEARMKTAASPSSTSTISGMSHHFFSCLQSSQNSLNHDFTDGPRVSVNAPKRKESVVNLFLSATALLSSLLRILASGPYFPRAACS